MTHERITVDLDELVTAAARLIEHRWPDEQALADHCARITRLLDPNLIFSIDHVHRAHLAASS